MRRPDLPVEPIGLSRTEAAAFIGVGATLFDELVESGAMPRPKAIGGRRVWSRYELERAFADLPVAGLPSVAKNATMQAPSDADWGSPRA